MPEPEIARSVCTLARPPTADRRSICRETSDGNDPLTISALTIRFYRASPGRCTASDDRPWEESLCIESEDRRAGVLPDRIFSFDPNGIRLGDFGIPGAATNGDYPLADDRRLVSAADAEIGTVTAACHAHPYANRPIHCEMRRPIAAGVDLYWNTAAPQDAVGEVLPRTEAFARSLCSDVFKHPDCSSRVEATP